MVAGIFPNTAEAEWAPSSAVSPATSLTAAHALSSVRRCCLLSTPAVNGGGGRFCSWSKKKDLIGCYDKVFIIIIIIIIIIFVVMPEMYKRGGFEIFKNLKQSYTRVA